MPFSACTLLCLCLFYPCHSFPGKTITLPPSKYRGIKLTRLGIFAALQSISQAMQPFPLNGFRLLINCIFFSILCHIIYQSNTEIVCVLISSVLFKLHFNRMPAEKTKSLCSYFFALYCHHH